MLPLQAIVGAEPLPAIAVGSVTVAVVVAEQPFEFVTITLYVPAVSPKISSVIAVFDQVKVGEMPFVTIKLIAPVEKP